MSTATVVKPTGPVELPGHESANVLTLTKHQGHALSTRNDYLPVVDPQAVEQAMMIGDLSQMTPDVRIAYYVATCKSVGLNPLTRPFQALKADDGSIVLYPDKGCAEQLRKRDKVSLRIVSREYVDDLYIVTVEASTPDGRKEESEGVVVALEAKGTWESFENKKGETKRFKKEQLDAQGNPTMVRLKGTDMANARMRCETKAKRRATLAICGLGMPDAGEGHPIRFDPQRGTLEEEETGTDAEVVDVTPLRATERAKSQADHIEDFTGHRPQVRETRTSATDEAAPVAAADSLAAVQARLGWTAEGIKAWENKQAIRFKKTFKDFTPEMKEGLITELHEQYPQGTPQEPQEGGKVAGMPSTAQIDTPEATSNAQDASAAIPGEYANMDPETGEMFDVQASAALDRQLEVEGRDENEPF